MDLERRGLLGMGLLVIAQAAAKPPTPGQVLGPYYPVQKPQDQDADLTQVNGRLGRAAGRIVEVSGRVLDREGRPVKGARLDIWQANAAGRYTHPSDHSATPIDLNFEGYALLTSDADGRYRFVTIRPGPYPDDGAGGLRAPHIHFEVTGRVNRLVTQMYFPDEPLNAQDRIMRIAGGRAGRLVAADLGGGAAPRRLAWDVVLREG